MIAFISIGNQILTNREKSYDTSWRLCIAFSLMAGIVGIILSLNRVYVAPDMVLDFKNAVIVLAAALFGFAGVLVTGAMLAVYVLLYDAGSTASVVEALAVVIMAIGGGLIAKYAWPEWGWRQWFTILLWSVAVSVIAVVIRITDVEAALQWAALYGVSFIAISAVIYVYVNYLKVLSVYYRSYKENSLIDYRTGLNNIRQFEEKFGRIVQNLTDQSLIAMLFIDIDFFKKINDRYGHKNGDKVLEDLGKILISSCNHMDIVSRNGGEEFSVLMTDCPREKILDVAERIRKAVQDYKFILLGGDIVHMTVSIGVAVYPDTVKDIQRLVEIADKAMYEAKRSGRNKVVVAKP
ncbi:MAG: GGDEF domain-containing protein [Peptococcaceae bacterium]|jgi:diguanylate cyclase|nr:GGDEF domain-containing protein [Peptococcaceae bacterium]